MNFYFGHLHHLADDSAYRNQTEWLNKTIFAQYSDRISTHIEQGFSLTLISDPQKICPEQSRRIYVNDNFVCATDCQLFNKTQLASELLIDADSCNEEFFIAAFLKWGREFPDKFDGKFSFVIWDRKNKSLLSGIDALGYGNFCYSKDEDDFYFSSDLGVLLNQAKIDNTVNLKRLYQCLCNTNNNSPEQTYFKHCFYCPPSHVLEFSSGELRTIDYWRLNQKQHQQNNNDLNENCLKFNSILEQALIKEVPKNSKPGLMLSGGYDSNLLAAILSQDPQKKADLICYSYCFSKFKTCDESEYITQTLKQLGIQGKLINCDDRTALTNINSHKTTHEYVHLDPFSGLPRSIYEQANQDHCSILISGLNGDDIFSGTRLMYADLLKQKKLSTVVKKFLSTSSIKDEFDKLIHLGIRPLLPIKIKKLYRNFVKAKSSGWNPFDIDPSLINNIENQPMLVKCKLFHCQNLLKLIYFRNISEENYFFRKHLYLDYKLIYCLPYYNKKMIEFMWTLPKEFLQIDGKIRGLQLNSLKLVGLDHIVKRVGKTTFGELIDTGLEQNNQYIEKTIANSLLLKNNLIARKSVIKLYNQIGLSHTARDLVRYCFVEIWLKQTEHKNILHLKT